MTEQEPDFFAKAEESLAGAESEFINSRYNNCANRCYYSCFQAAISALLSAGITPPGQRDEWGHDFVQAQFNGTLIKRRHLYPAEFRTILGSNFSLRVRADYTEGTVTRTDAERALRRARLFVTAISEGGERR